MEIVTTLPASVHTCAKSVKDPVLRQNVNSVFNLEAWEQVLRDHPDEQFKQFIITGIKYGVNIGHNGISHDVISENWPSSLKHRNAVSSVIQRDLTRGRKLGPFQTPPPGFVGSPLGAFEKKRSPGKYRVIHDLSWPPGRSINENIYLDCSVHYITIDNIVCKIKAFGLKGVKMAKLDLEDAYKHIFVRIQDRPLLGLVWDTIDNDGTSHREYFLDITLPFGLKSSAMLFNKYADGLEYAMLKNGTTVVSHYLDDYFTCGHPETMDPVQSCDYESRV